MHPIEKHGRIQATFDCFEAVNACGGVSDPHSAYEIGYGRAIDDALKAIRVVRDRVEADADAEVAEMVSVRVAAE